MVRALPVADRRGKVLIPTPAVVVAVQVLERSAPGSPERELAETVLEWSEAASV